MSEYWYYQNSEEGRWLSIEDCTDPEAEVRKRGGRKMSILCISQLVGDDADVYTDRFDLKYRGPLYFDIDCGPEPDEINQAIAAAAQLVRTLLSTGVQDTAIEIVLSGKKGLHVMVDQRAVMGSRNMTTALPAIYRKIAERLYVEGMDFAVYGARRGNCFRLVNLERENYPAFPVHITIEELWTLTPELYREYVAAPREVPPVPEKVERCDGLFDLYKWAKERVAAEQKHADKRIPMTDAAKHALQEKMPPCIELLLKGKRQMHATYNQIGCQIGAYARVVDMPRAQRRSLGFMVADNTPSNNNKAQKERRRLVMAGLETTVRRQNYEWSCGAMRKLLDKPPCDDCTVKDHWQHSQAESAREAQVLEYDDQFFVKMFDANGDEVLKRLTNFTLEPVRVIVEKQDDPSLPDRRLWTRCQVRTPAGQYGFIDVVDSAFNSKGNFTKQLTGHGNLAFWGTDNQVQTLREYLFSEEKMSDAAKVTQVDQAGMHVFRLPGTDEFIKVYVEPGYSVDNRGRFNTHAVKQDYGASPSYYTLKPLSTENTEAQSGRLTDPREKQELESALRSLFSLADPDIMGLLVGWMVATHLKSHIAAINYQFPMLHFWGPAGAGKTITMKLVSALCGLDNSEGLITSASTAKSGFAVRTLMCTSTTVPRFFDELNLNNFDSDLCHRLLHFMKLNWDGSSWKQGALDRTESGARIESTALTAPCVFMGEQDISGFSEATAVAHRTVSVFFTKDMHGREENARAMMERRHWIVKLSYVLMKMALWQRPEEVFRWRDQFIPLTPSLLPDRPRLSYATVFMGLEFLKNVLQGLGISEELLGEVDKLKEAVKVNINVNAVDLSMAKNKTQVTNMLSEIAAYMSVENFRLEMKNAPAMQTKGDHLYILVPAMHTVYRAYCRRIGQMPVIPQMGTFMQLLQQEKYVASMQHMSPDILKGRSCVMLGLPEMAMAGIDISMLRDV